MTTTILPQTKRKRTFRRLRRRMLEKRVTLLDIELAVGLSKSSVGDRMAGRIGWSLHDAYKILDLLELPYSSLPEYFPKNIWEEAV